MRDDYDHHDQGARSPGEARREVDLFDLTAFAWASRTLIAIVFLALFIPMAIAAWFLITPTFEAQSRLLVMLDADDPTPGAAGTGAPFTLDQVMQSEIEILNSNTVRRLALDRMGRAADPAALNRMGSRFSVDRSPNASVLVASYTDPDAPRSARTLNAIVDAYLDYRQQVLVEDAEGAIAERLAAAETAAGTAEDALRDFLSSHGIADFPAERDGAVQRVTELQNSLLAAQAAGASARGGASALAQRLNAMPRNIELYVENDATGQVLALEMRRRELLARYLPDSPPVLAIERELDALRDFINAGGAEGSGQRRTGANPVYQDLDSARLQYEATAEAQSGLAAAIEAQYAAARAESDRLRALAPRYNQLFREASSRSQAAERLSAQSAAAASRHGAAAGGADAVRIIERATEPARPSSLRNAAIAAAGILALGAAILVGLVRGYVAAIHPGGFSPRLRGPGGLPPMLESREPAAIPPPANQLTGVTASVPVEPRALTVLARVRDRAAPDPSRTVARAAGG